MMTPRQAAVIVGVAAMVTCSDLTTSAQSTASRSEPASIEAVFVRSLGGGLLDGHFNSPHGIAVDDQSRVFVTDGCYSRVQVFDTDGKFLYKWGTYGDAPGEFRRPWGIALDAAGQVYVTDRASSRIQVFTNGGRFVRAWGSVGSAPGQFRHPEGIAVHRDGTVFVADSYNLRVQVFTAEGRFLRSWGGARSRGDGQFVSPGWKGPGPGPAGIAVSAAGEVYVSDPSNSRVQVFTIEGTFLRKWGPFATPAATANGRRVGTLIGPTGLALEPTGHVLVISSGGGATGMSFNVQRWTPTGEFQRRWGGIGYAPGEFDTPVGIAVDANGNFYVADTGNNRVQKFNRHGGFVTQWGSSGDGWLRGPIDVALDPSGNVYVADGRNSRIQKFAPDGTFLTAWGSPKRTPTGAGHFVFLHSIAVDVDSRVYVSDTVDHRIQVFSHTGQFIRMWGGRGDGSGALEFPRDLDVDRARQGYVLDSRRGADTLEFPGALALDRAGHVYVLDHQRLVRFTTDGRSPGFLKRPADFRATDLAIGGDGNIYFVETSADSGLSRIRIISPAGTEPASWPLPSSGDGKRGGRTRMALDPAGRVFVVDSRQCQVEVFGSNGTYAGRWGSCGFGEGQFGEASGIAVDATGQVFVADYTNNRVHVFQVTRTPGISAF
jgi:DNA-binding beta-propeller fold protein YncE